MWPILLDMTKEESMQHLRCLEIDAFSGLLNALRAQGGLDPVKLNLLRETSSLLHISQERHKAEIRRVVNDERLNTIAYHVNGERYCGEEWADEGQRLIPLLPRVAPQTAYSAIADEVADVTSKLNKQLPLPASTERKRLAVPSPTIAASASSSGSVAPNIYRGVEVDRKRKHSLSLENCMLAQHLMAPPKISQIQQIYRQRSKSRLKEQLVRLKSQEQPETPNQPNRLHKTVPTPTPKINILQNITTSLPHRSVSTPTTTTNPDKRFEKEFLETPPSTAVVTSTSKTITTTDGQKLIVVSTHANHNLSPTPSILQRTLTTIPFKRLGVNPKFRIVPKATNVVPNVLSNCTPSNAKKIIPMSKVQVLNTKTGFKVLPLNAKIAVKGVKNQVEITHEVNGVTNVDDNVEKSHCDNGIDNSTEENIEFEADGDVLAQNETVESTENHFNDIPAEEMEIIEDITHTEVDCVQEQVIEDIPLEQTEIFEEFPEKTEMDSSVFIYGENDNESEEVIIDGMASEGESLEVLNAVHALDESFPNTKNVRS